MYFPHENGQFFIRLFWFTGQAIVEQEGLQPGGLNFDAKVRRESTDPEDLFIAHIGAMDAFARGLRNAAKIIKEGVMQNMLQVTHIVSTQNTFLNDLLGIWANQARLR